MNERKTMPDRESAITHLQIISTWASFARERDLQFFTAKHLEDISQWANDAIALLKGQEEEIENLKQTAQSMMEGICLLKEQEPVEPRKENDGNPEPWTCWWYVCGSCGKEIDVHDRFCRQCGKKAKWE